MLVCDDCLLLYLTGFLNMVFTLLPNDSTEIVYLVLNTLQEKVIYFIVCVCVRVRACVCVHACMCVHVCGFIQKFHKKKKNIDRQFLGNLYLLYN